MESDEARIKRLKMRSMRRGIKEMDIILSRYADTALVAMSDEDLRLYDALLAENDQDLYQWVSGQAAAPERFRALLAHITEVNRIAVENVAK